MKLALTMTPKGWSRTGSVAFSGPVNIYQVHGLPSPQEALIADRGNANRSQWKVLRVRENPADEWYGEFATADEALQTLQKQCEAEAL